MQANITLPTSNRHQNIFSNSSTKKNAGFKIKDPGSAITHFIGFVFALLATPMMITHGLMLHASFSELTSLVIFMISMILLYGASTTYHTFDISPKINKILKKIDHMMIFVLIAGSYTPICVIGLDGNTGLSLLLLVWIMAAIGMLFKLCWVTCPKWVSSVIYIGMGWLCLLAMPQIIRNLSPAAFGWLLAGGLIYTVGGIIYALKLNAFNLKFQHFGSHEIFHLFVMAGSFCHFIVMYQYLLS